jgi:hypothetical protein
MIAGRLLLRSMGAIIPCLMQAQEPVIAEDSITLGGFFRKIEEQTPYTVAYSHAILDPSRKIPVPGGAFGSIRWEDALSGLFAEMPYSWTINGNHIIILPAGRGDADLSGELPAGRKRPFTFKGAVRDRQTGDILEYATVFLLDAGDRMLSVGITDETGSFRIETPRLPRKIKIHFIGYETFVKDIGGMNENLGTFPLETAAFPLEEITVTERKNTKADRDVYRITPQMREGTVNVTDLLDKIHGVYYDKSTQTFRVNGRDGGILLMLDGMLQSPVYLMHLSSRQIRAVEIIREPSGRLLAGGYGAIINLIPEKQAKDYDVFVSDITAANLSGNNGKDRMAKEQPVAGISRTNPKISLYATYLYNRERWNMPMQRELVYDGVRVPFASDPSDRYRSQNHHLAAGATYRVNDKHVLSFEADYTDGNLYSEYEYMTEGHVLSNISDRTLKNRTQNLTINRIAAERISWQGTVNNRLHLYGDVHYDYYYNDMESLFDLIDDDRINNIDGNLYSEYKRQAGFNLEARYRLTAQSSMDMGYTGGLRKYASESAHGKGFFDYNEYRHVAFACFTGEPSGKIKVRAGLGVESVRIRNRNAVKNLARFLPYLQIKYSVTPSLEMNINYTATPYYPVLYQLSPMTVKVDSILSQTGNPDLTPSLRHTVSARLYRHNSLTVEPSFRFTRNAVSESYMKSDYRLYRTFRNFDTQEYALYGCYEHPLGKHVRLTGNLTFYHARTAGAGAEANTASGWLAGAEAHYYHPDRRFGLLAGYYRNMKKNLLRQGYQMLDKDNWLLEASRIFPRQGLSVTLSWIPPLSFGIRDEQIKRMDTPVYKETSRINLGACYNTLLLKVHFRFNSGIRPNRQPDRNSVTKGERQEQGT